MRTQGRMECMCISNSIRSSSSGYRIKWSTMSNLDTNSQQHGPFDIKQHIDGGAPGVDRICNNSTGICREFSIDVRELVNFKDKVIEAFFNFQLSRIVDRDCRYHCYDMQWHQIRTSLSLMSWAMSVKLLELGPLIKGLGLLARWMLRESEADEAAVEA